jgi:hypothetical protein
MPLPVALALLLILVTAIIFVGFDMVARHNDNVWAGIIRRHEERWLRRTIHRDAPYASL